MAVWILDAELAGPRSARCRSCSRSPRCAHGLRGRRSRRRRRGCRYSRCCPKGEARARSRSVSPHPDLGRRPSQQAASLGQAREAVVPCGQCLADLREPPGRRGPPAGRPDSAGRGWGCARVRRAWAAGPGPRPAVAMQTNSFRPRSGQSLRGTAAPARWATPPREAQGRCHLAKPWKGVDGALEDRPHRQPRPPELVVRGRGAG